PVVRVGDASLVVGVCNKLLNPNTRESYSLDLRQESEKARARYLASQGTRASLVSIGAAREKVFATDWAKAEIAKPKELGVRTLDNIPLEEIAPYIDWSPFFWAWEMKGTYPKILANEKWGEQARELFAEAQKMLAEIIANKRFRARAVVGFWPANAVGDDVVLYRANGSNERLETLHFLRQQKEKEPAAGEIPYFSLADYVAPASSNRTDYVGGFAVTAGFEVEEYAASFAAKGDDYSAIIVKALGDRFAEATAEYVHKKMREEWGFGKNEDLSNEDLIAEKYRGVRPAPGYPACPDHTEKRTLWKLLGAEEKIGVSLTTSCAMNPPSSVSGYYFAHPAAKYFHVGLIGKDQVADYAARKGMAQTAVEKWLGPNLDYEPA
ncbi:MAG: methionine synthase, partial [Proteobacteria bacterium]